MKKNLYKVTTTFFCADHSSSFYFDTIEKATRYLDSCNNGEINEVIISCDADINYSDGCTFNDFTFGGILKVTETEVK